MDLDAARRQRRPGYRDALGQLQRVAQPLAFAAASALRPVVGQPPKRPLERGGGVTDDV